MQNDIIFGIRFCVEKAAQEVKELCEGDFETEKAKGEYELIREKIEFQFKDYAPNVFHKIRSNLGVTPEEFLESWVLQEQSTMTLSTARSGSMFYKTPDSKYLFKTILHPEVGAMCDLLKDYYEHIENEPQTFIVRIYGLFRLTYKKRIGSPTWILVMGNGFPVGVHMDEVYDLKGRTPKKGKAPGEREVMSKGAKKDNEILRTLHFYPSSKKFYIEQLQKDVTVLKKHNIMDYSLLVGIHKLTPEEKAILTSMRDADFEAEEFGDKAAGDKVVEKETKENDKKSGEKDPKDVKDEQKNQRNNENENDNEKRKEKDRDKGKEKDRGKDKGKGKTNENEEDKGKGKEKEREKDEEGKEKGREKDEDDTGKGKEKEKGKEKGKAKGKEKDEDDKVKGKEKERDEEDRGKGKEKDRDEEDKGKVKEKDSEDKGKEDEEGEERKQSNGKDKENKDKGKERIGVFTHHETKTLEEFADDPNAMIFLLQGLLARNPDTGEEEMIFLSIIDNLTNYNIKKKVANMCKRMLWEEDTLSTVRSDFYASRFLEWMTKSLLYGEGNADARPEEEIFEEFALGLRRSSSRRLRSASEVPKFVASDTQVMDEKKKPDILFSDPKSKTSPQLTSPKGKDKGKHHHDPLVSPKGKDKTLEIHSKGKDKAKGRFASPRDEGGEKKSRKGKGKDKEGEGEREVGGTEGGTERGGGSGGGDGTGGGGGSNGSTGGGGVDCGDGVGKGKEECKDMSSIVTQMDKVELEVKENEEKKISKKSSKKKENKEEKVEAQDSGDGGSKLLKKDEKEEKTNKQKKEKGKEEEGKEEERKGKEEKVPKTEGKEGEKVNEEKGNDLDTDKDAERKPKHSKSKKL
eukprot:TRINITY_DN5782_c0_g1_i6.p1 TRINITY_DN5782_c0_g1~~TRINITY_DN5782_c0_g1_i6.p1  ORF type:complete len:857 (-),score=341.97 TRINITY_DN5782_c0_g1_i6:253-2823(-)